MTDFPGKDDMPELRILRNSNVNAYAQGGNTVAIELGLSQLISDSPSELAAVIGHEIGHIYVQRGGPRTDPRPEYDADLWGTVLAIGAGYDPYGLAGALAKLSMATGVAGLTSQFEEQVSGEAHGSFNERLANVFETLQSVCSQPDLVALCAEYKAQFHPNLPSVAPLNIPGGTPPRLQFSRPKSRSSRKPFSNMRPLSEDALR